MIKGGLERVRAGDKGIGAGLRSLVMFCELYPQLARATRRFADRNASVLVFSDANQLRVAFTRAAVRGGIDATQADESFAVSNVIDIGDETARRSAIEAVLGKLIGDANQAVGLLEAQVTAIASDSVQRKELRERLIEPVANDERLSRTAFETIQTNDFAGECSLVDFLESSQSVIEENWGEQLANYYYNLLERFIEKFSLRYDLRRPCLLCPTVTGVFASLMRNLQRIAGQDVHLGDLLNEFEDAVRDLKHGSTDRRIKTCIQKQINFLEAMGQGCPGVTGTTLGAICDQVGTWPHEKLKEAIKSLYKFTCDYPGIRHGGTAASALRVVDMRDMVALCVLLAGFTPYLSHALDADLVYRGT